MFILGTISNDFKLKSSLLPTSTREQGSRAEDWARNLRPRKEVRPEFNSGDDKERYRRAFSCLRMTVGQYLGSIRNFLFPSIDLFLSHP
jgi:hypothetical protein